MAPLPAGDGGGSPSSERVVNNDSISQIGDGESSRKILSTEAASTLSGPNSSSDALRQSAYSDQSSIKTPQSLSSLELVDPARVGGKPAALNATLDKWRLADGLPPVQIDAARTMRIDGTRQPAEANRLPIFADTTRQEVPSLQIGDRTREAAPAVPGDRVQVKPGSLSADRSMQDLISDRSFSVSDRQMEKRVGDGKISPMIKVGFENHSGTGLMRPDFIVKQDGTVEIVGDPNRKMRQADISIQVERNVGQLRPSAAQQAAVDELSTYVANKIKQEHPKDVQYGVKLSDTQNLVTAQAEKAMGARNASELSRLPELTRRQIEDMNRFDGGGRGRMTRREADSYFPTRNGQPPTEAERIEAMKDVVAGFSTHRHKKPYENIGYRSDRGRTIGRYGLGYDQVSEWLESKTAQDITNLATEGKIPAKQAERLQQMKDSIERHKSDPNAPLDPFLEKMKNPNRKDHMTKAEVAASLGKEAQEAMAGDLVRRYAWETIRPDGTIDIAKVALSMQIGHSPTEQDMKKAENRSFLRAANQAYSISESRHTSPTADGPIDWTDVNGKTLRVAQNSVGRVMWGDFAGSVRGGRLGCAASVTKVLEHAGIGGIRSAGVRDLAAQAQQHGYERLPISQARPGDIVYGTQPGRSYGGSAHVGIVGTDGTVFHNRSSTGRWSQNDLHSVFSRRRFGGNLWVLRAPERK